LVHRRVGRDEISPPSFVSRVLAFGVNWNPVNGTVPFGESFFGTFVSYAWAIVGGDSRSVVG
jgi:hypothetical protein